MKTWRDCLDPFDFPSAEFSEGHVPAYDPETVIRCRNLCAENACGDYGRTWSCPPGFDGTMERYSKNCDLCLVMSKAYVLDPKDRAEVAQAGTDFKSLIRKAVRILRSEGFVCNGFGDGGCDYCGECAYPDPCRFPEVLIPSISALGIDLKEYLGALGMEFSFRDDAMTLYALLLIGSPQ